MSAAPELAGPSSMKSPSSAARVFVLAVIGYGAIAWAVGRTQSGQLAYFDRLADAFLKGRLHLVAPPHTRDLTEHDGRWYVPFPPLPALLMTPWRLFDLPIHSVLFSILFGALTIAAFGRLLEIGCAQGWLALSGVDRGWLTALAAFGSVLTYVAIDGEVWFIAQVCTTAMLALAAVSAGLGRSPWITGGLLALAVLGRPHVALTWPLLLGLEMQRRRAAGVGVRDRGALIWSVQSLVPVMIAVGVLLAYNLARFGDPLDFGYVAQNVDIEVKGPLLQYGQFHPHFLLQNLHAMWIAWPIWSARHGFLMPSDRGMGLFWTMPVLLCLIGLAIRKPEVRRATRPVCLGAGAATLMTMGVLLLYYNTGWRQFGYRFFLDFAIPLLLLLALAVPTLPRWSWRGLVALGILINLAGLTWWFKAWPAMTG